MTPQPRRIPFEEIRQVDLEGLLANRELQRDIHLTTQKTESNGRQNPVVLFEHNSGPYPQPFYGTFSISDREHIYFFPEFWADHHSVPDYLRSEDMVPSGITSPAIGDIPFNKQLWRVNVSGGHPERYDAKKGEFVEDANYTLLTRTPTREEREILGLTKRHTLFD